MFCNALDFGVPYFQFRRSDWLCSGKVQRQRLGNSFSDWDQLGSSISNTLNSMSIIVCIKP